MGGRNIRMQVSEVFGVNKEMVLSYFTREFVDGKFEQELRGDKHIIIYGSSKQGKSALVLAGDSQL